MAIAKAEAVASAAFTCTPRWLMYRWHIRFSAVPAD